MPEVLSGPVHIHTLDFGAPAATPVLLIHGIQGCGGLWENVARLLAARGCRPVAYDLRGHGASDRAADYSLTAHVGDAIAVLHELGLAPAHVIGHSLGGRIAWELAAARPDLVRRLVIEDQHPDANPAGLPYWQEWARTWPRRFATREAGLAWLEAEGRSLPWWEPSLVPFPDGGWGWAMDIEGVVETARWLQAEDGWGSLARVQAEDGWGSLARVQAPTLLLRGAESEHLKPDVAARMAAVLPAGRLVTVEGRGHWVHKEAERYAALVGDFLAAP